MRGSCCIPCVYVAGGGMVRTGCASCPDMSRVWRAYRCAARVGANAPGGEARTGGRGILAMDSTALAIVIVSTAPVILMRCLTIS